ncbi:hypothetical protein Tco_0982630, partial [Tanacetum coccineum]
MQSGGPPRADGYNTYRKDHYQPYVSPRQSGQKYENRRFKNRRQEVNQLSLDSLVKRLKEILATELQLQLPPPPLLVGTPKKENLDKYCDYHEEKGHYTNDCFQLKKQLEIALESKKLNHLVKDVRQKGGNQGKQVGNSNNNGKIINMVYEMGYAQKPEVEGYLVRRVFVDQGAAVQVMFEHCFRNLCPTIQAHLTRTHTELVGFSGEQLLPIRKIELEVMFGSEGLSRRTMMKFTVTVRKQVGSFRGVTQKGNGGKGKLNRGHHGQPGISGSKNYHQNSLSSPIGKVVKRQQGRVRLVAVGHGRHPEMDKLTFFKRESDCHFGSIKMKGPEPR